MIHYKGVPLVTHCNYDGVEQAVVPQSSGFHELLIEELRVIPLADHLSIQKLTHVLFQRVWWPKLHGTMTLFFCLYTTSAQTKDSTTSPPAASVLQPLPVLES